MENATIEIKKTEINYYNPITNSEDILSIQKMPVNRVRLNSLQRYKDDEDIYNILNNILKDIDLSKTVCSMLPCTTDSVRYISSMSEYIYYLEHSINQLEYNHWIDVLIERHIMNLIIEKEYIPPVVQKTKDKKAVSKKDNLKNMFYRRECIPFNLFNEEEFKYEYINPKTGEIIKSNDPNLCDKLNDEINKIKNKNKPKRTGGTGQKRERIVRAKVTRDFTNLHFKF